MERYEYDAYGNTKIYDSNGDEISKSLIGNRYCFQGREIDWETGLYNFRARWYDPDTGRWCSKDPIGIAGGLNLYEAFGNNAVNFIDPMGLEKNQMKQLAGAFGLAAAADLTKTGLQLMATGNIPAIIGGAALVTAGIILGKGSLNLIRN